MIKNPIILVDGSFYIHKAYYAFPPLTTSNGKSIWVVYGVINMIKSLLIRYQPQHISIVFDTAGKTFRENLFEKYKANRAKMPKNLISQIHPLYEIIYAMGIPILQRPNVEADDVIATLAVSHARLGRTVLISTEDKDMAQVISSKIFLINTKSNSILTPQDIKKKFGVSPILIPDYLALVGDRADNIPGVFGIGKKTAQILLNKIGNLDILYKKLDNIPTLGIRNSKKILDSLINNKETALLSHQLASIQTNIFLEPKDYVLSKPILNIKDLIKLFEKYEFNYWLTELKLGIWLKKYNSYYTTIPITHKKNNIYLNQHIFQNNLISNKSVNSCKIIYNTTDLTKWIETINTTDFLIMNIYSDTFNTDTTKIINICLSIYQNKVINHIYIPSYNAINTLHQWDKQTLHIKNILLILKPILENSKIKKIGQNMKFHYSLLKKYNINLVGITFDIAIELYILYGAFNYKYIKRYLNSNTFNAIIEFKTAYNKYYNSDLKFRNIYSESECSYELMNTMFNLHQILWKQIKENNQLRHIFENIEIPLISILSNIETYGVLIDKKILHDHELMINFRLNNLKQQIYQLVNTTFNINSTKQLQEILYNQLKLPILKKTSKGSPSTSEEVLKQLSKKYFGPKIILEYRSLSKLKSTYTNKLISMINQESNRIHTSYNQTRTATGRLSSAHPNLQNIPNRNYYGRKIRQAFIAPTNSLIVSADYSQIELRIMAHLSRDLKLINDFLSGKDIHATTASEIFVTALHLVTSEQRHQAKTINFGLIYGMSAFGLARQLSLTCKEAQQYVDRYFQRYPGIMQYMKYAKYNAIQYGYVSTLNGRKLYLPDIYSSNISQKKSAERAAINAPMQGSASDIIKKAMVSIHYWLQNDNIPVRMIMQVHDELVFEVQHSVLELAIKQIKKLMEECFTLDVPLKVDIGIGKNWEQAH